MTRVRVRHPAGTVNLGNGLEVDVSLDRHALGSLIHARVPVFCADGPGCLAHPGTVEVREPVGTAVLATYRTEPDGSAVDLEWDVALYADAEPPPPSGEGHQAVLAAARVQLDRLLAGADDRGAAMLGWVVAWKGQPGVSDAELAAIMRDAGL